MKLQHFVAAVGFVLVVVGLALGLAPASVNDRTGEVACGSPFAQNRDVGQRGFEFDQDTVDACQDAFGGRLGLGWGLIGVGAVAAIGGLVVRSGNRAAA